MQIFSFGMKLTFELGSVSASTHRSPTRLQLYSKDKTSTDLTVLIYPSQELGRGCAKTFSVLAAFPKERAGDESLGAALVHCRSQHVARSRGKATCLLSASFGFTGSRGRTKRDQPPCALLWRVYPAPSVWTQT